jgi:hypothetical protein
MSIPRLSKKAKGSFDKTRKNVISKTLNVKKIQCFKLTYKNTCSAKLVNVQMSNYFQKKMKSYERDEDFGHKK